MVNRAKEKPCAHCNQNYPRPVMDLHHIDPSKKGLEISKLVYRCSYSALQEEISKCVPLCANCHRMVHAGLIKLEDPAIQPKE